MSVLADILATRPGRGLVCLAIVVAMLGVLAVVFPER